MPDVTHAPPKPPPRSLLQKTPRPPARPELRRTPRFKVDAFVLVDHAGTKAKLAVLNVSATGALVGVTSTGPALRVGALLFLTLSTDRGPLRSVDVNARVVRRTETEIAIDWSDDQAVVDSVGALLLTTTPPPPKP